MQLRNIKSYDITVKEFILPFYGKIKKKTVSSELKLLFSYVSVLKSAEMLYENPLVEKNHFTHWNNEAQPCFLVVLLCQLLIQQSVWSLSTAFRCCFPHTDASHQSASLSWSA